MMFPDSHRWSHAYLAMLFYLKVSTGFTLQVRLWELYVNLFSSPKSYDSTSVLNPKSMTYSRMSFKNIQFHSISKYKGKQNPCLFLINSSFFYELTLLMDSLSRYRKPGILEPSEVISLRHHNAQTVRPPTLRT